MTSLPRDAAIGAGAELGEPAPSVDEHHGPRIVTIVQATDGWSMLAVRELWAYRELLVYLVWRELQGTYRQTALGLSWLFLRPVVSIFFLSLAFGVVVNVQSDGVPYPLFAAAALLPWGFFQSAVLRSSGSLVANLHIISKVFFPRMILPIASVLSGLVDFAAAAVVFVGLLVAYRMPLRVEMVWLPFFLLCAVLVALSFGLWSASLSVRFRDVAFAMAFLLQGMMYLTPVIYPLSQVPASLQPLYLLNPMTGVVQGFRWALLGSNGAPGWPFAFAMSLTLVFLLFGAFILRRTERTIVDHL